LQGHEIGTQRHWPSLFASSLEDGHGIERSVAVPLLPEFEFPSLIVEKAAASPLAYSLSEGLSFIPPACGKEIEKAKLFRYFHRAIYGVFVSASRGDGIGERLKEKTPSLFGFVHLHFWRFYRVGEVRGCHESAHDSGEGFKRGKEALRKSRAPLRLPVIHEGPESGEKAGAGFPARRPGVSDRRREFPLCGLACAKELTNENAPFEIGGKAELVSADEDGSEVRRGHGHALT